MAALKKLLVQASTMSVKRSNLLPHPIVCREKVHTIGIVNHVKESQNSSIGHLSAAPSLSTISKSIHDITLTKRFWARGAPILFLSCTLLPIISTSQSTIHNKMFFVTVSNNFTEVQTDPHPF